MNPLLSFLILLILLVFSGLFSATETALFSLTKIEKRRIRRRHVSLSKWVNYLLEHPRRTLIAILVGNLLVNNLAAAMVTLMAVDMLGGVIAPAAIIVFTFLLIIFGEILPKTLAVKKNEVFSLAIALPLHLFSTLIFPIRWATEKITDFLLEMLLPEVKEKSEHFSEDELKTLVSIGEEEGVLDREERRMILKVFELGERPVKDIMTPRVDLAALDIDDSRDEHEQIIKKSHFAYFPVYQDTVDNVLGIISAQEYLLNPAEGFSKLMLQPLFVPEVKRIDELLAEFRKKDRNFAICVDEHGGTDGIVTLEDILEEVFGEFYDEYEKVKNPIRPFGHESFIVEAKIALSDFNEYFDDELEADEASTLGGYILEKLGEVPQKETVLEAGNFEIKIHEVIRHRRIRSVIVRKLA